MHQHIRYDKRDILRFVLRLFEIGDFEIKNYKLNAFCSAGFFPGGCAKLAIFCENVQKRVIIFFKEKKIRRNQGRLGEDAGGEVAFAGVGEEGDDGFGGVFRFLGFAECGGEGGAG